MSGSEILVAALEREMVDTIFAYPGGASMELHQALTRSDKIRVILPRHEQGGVFAAEGYARASGRPGVCMATSGPGATNLVTGIADAFMDSTPLVAITGQVPQAMIGKGAFQETDFFGMTLPIVKHSFLITDIADIPRVVKEAFHVAATGRPGPVVIDLPKNIQQAKAQPVFPKTVNIRGYDPMKKASDLELNEIIGLIQKAERPVLYVGGGIISGEAHHELRELVKLTGIPVTSTIMGCGAFPESDPLSLRWLGMHGAAFANWAVSGEFKKETDADGEVRVTEVHPGADLLLAFGVRFDDRVTGKVEKFCENGTIVHVDIDDSEHNKNRKVQLPVVSDVKYALGRLVEMIRERPILTSFDGWHRRIEDWKKRGAFLFNVNEEVMRSQHMRDHLQGMEDQVILPQMTIDMLYELTQGDAIVTTGVGQHQMWAGQWYKYDEPRRYITSAGLGSMGFGYPAAMGAKVACPDRQVVDIDGDGSFLMNVQELATAHIEKIAAKAIILNNQHLGMVMQWEDRFYQGNRGNTYLGDPENMKAIYPDYVTMAKGFGVTCERVMFRKDLKAAMQRMLDSDQPYLLDVVVPYTEHVLPFIPAGHTVADMIIS
ncbi:MAG TPA: biosynthetic-type acetolactate synthase large subunit [Verrucomicrobiales bacterium]|nr:biosynthetic-type acetolactate synthase large subunit [Verrucomicrobiales bacterium]HAR00463.1 biosynthetic-type acetolactate synthase large subunit [Verrucomicrobiales bacterium]HAW02401.1 biosynthetic-type acetolactate synthase large subunit [Verrucomicrobiales bacterium]HBP54323.1 biosynthetic-type acetolactate synthase large subunit [Verrucomicrobiales bacterium]HCP39780.1 biosynthetic-type acetolactate synthase large subunit [Verrucomicrobiales bacterium]